MTRTRRGWIYGNTNTIAISSTYQHNDQTCPSFDLGIPKYENWTASTNSTTHPPSPFFFSLLFNYHLDELCMNSFLN
ncbi:hypothetical protein BC937DRAFT_90107 [Endogone sp. FLAS-F59071]|nr:hypothetical protein BC937DRAFT_90107 [Endogone sp. FLAS-F59071]|eukprot:RUS17337.1 hypothetical protein BC937DRAFT_90107 [Endogone sp. FLAS-F59071]